MCGLLAKDLCAVFLISLTPDLLLSLYEWTTDDTNACIFSTLKVDIFLSFFSGGSKKAKKNKSIYFNASAIVDGNVIL
jgi:hypothetical protein